MIQRKRGERIFGKKKVYSKSTTTPCRQFPNSQTSSWSLASVCVVRGQQVEQARGESPFQKHPSARASLLAQLVKNPPAMCDTWVWSLGWEDPLEKGKATHSSILAWRIPWTVYSPWGCKELDTTEQLSLSLSSANEGWMLEVKCSSFLASQGERLKTSTLLTFLSALFTSYSLSQFSGIISQMYSTVMC